MTGILFNEHYEDEAPPYKVISRSFPRARKDRICTDCGKTIKKGQQYTRVAFLLDGEFGSAATHEEGGACAYGGCGCAGGSE